MLKVIGGTGLLGAIGWGASRLFQTGNPDTTSSRTRSTKAPPTTEPTRSLNSELQGYVDRLKAINQEIFAKPQNIKELAPKVGVIAVEYFCKELGYDPKKYEGRIRYETGQEYQKSREEESGCIERQNFEDEYARVYADSDSLTVNLDRVLYHDVKAKVLQPYPALSMSFTM